VVWSLVAVFADPDQRGLVASIRVHMAIDAVDGGVEVPADEPPVVRRIEGGL
jgi:hypothetical protein